MVSHEQEKALKPRLIEGDCMPPPPLHGEPWLRSVRLRPQRRMRRRALRNDSSTLHVDGDHPKQMREGWPQDNVSSGTYQKR